MHSMFQMYFSGLEAMGQTYDPFTKGFARAQLELMGLASRRAQALMEVPSRLSQCRTPQDVANEQLRFWRAAFEDYSESIGRATEAMATFAVPSFMPSFGFMSSSDDVQSVHDYITFPETKPEKRGHGRERRAAA